MREVRLLNYFIVSQDHRISNCVEPIGIAQVIKKEMLTEEGMKELENYDLQFQVLEKSTNNFLDFIEKPIPLLSDTLKRIMNKYEPQMPFVPVVLVELAKLEQQLYWLIIPPTIDCLSEKTEFFPDGTVKQLVIKEDLAEPYTIFKVKGIKEDYLIINIALAESILRREFKGIQLKKVKTEGQWNDRFTDFYSRKIV